MTVADLVFKLERNTYIWVSDTETAECYAKGTPDDMYISPHYQFTLLDVLETAFVEIEVPHKNEIIIRIEGSELL